MPPYEPRPRRLSATWTRLHKYALSQPEAYEDFPWGDCVAKVSKKIFIFLGDGTGEAQVSVKLIGDAHAHALSIPGAKPTAYNLGKAGWVTIPIKGVPLKFLIEWISESYRSVAPKRLVKPVGKA